MEPIIVYKECLLDWIKEQPNDRKIDMDRTNYSDPCGCLMVQYGKAIFNQEFHSVGYSCWWSYDPVTVEVASFDNFGIGDLIDDDAWNAVTDYGKLKAHLGL